MSIFVDIIHVKIQHMFIDELIKVTKLSEALGLDRTAINHNKIPKKYHKQIQELNDLINYWRKRNGENK